ncbi:hypothetical protein Y032_0005g2691 [Ancylostoma ceylanicum]|uniref:Uncharacterized protein n=1 Tax=Ancylostoma ceylanicum TaxID=53326 RepID=A0A016VSZ8_9BILA|nr:hypothetical protein Y032_0005g2691 [Ancylostoma ceylanicum]
MRQHLRLGTHTCFEDARPCIKRLFITAYEFTSLKAPRSAETFKQQFRRHLRGQVRASDGFCPTHVVNEHLKAASTEILTFEVSRSPCGRLPDSHNGNLSTEKSSLPAEILPWTQMRAWPFWCPPRQLTLLTWHATSGLAQCITLYKE